MGEVKDELPDEGKVMMIRRHSSTLRAQCKHYLPRPDTAASVLVGVETPLRLAVDSDARLDMHVVLLLSVEPWR